MVACGGGAHLVVLLHGADEVGEEPTSRMRKTQKPKPSGWRQRTPRTRGPRTSGSAATGGTSSMRWQWKWLTDADAHHS